MLNKLWPFFIIISVIYGIFSGNISNINSAVFTSATETINLCLSLAGSLCLWNGIMAIATKTSLIDKISLLLKPFTKFLLPDYKNDDEIQKQSSMNIVANLLGLGNASTPLGLKAISSMQEKNPNKEKLTNSMAMFILINTASIQIIPTTIIAIRSSQNSSNPTQVIFAVWCATIAAFLTAIILGKILSKFI